jgi:hypothetical protein
MKGTALRGPLNWVKKPWSPANAQTENLSIERVRGWPSLRCETPLDEDGCKEGFAVSPGDVPGELTCEDGWVARKAEPDTDSGKARGDKPVSVVFSKMSF